MSAMLRILADENIPFAREAFAPAGEVRFMSTRTIARQELMKTDALIVRSITRVTAEMLAGTPVRFVATATAGTDHLDLAGLAVAGIATASAGGSNAESVAQHVAAVLCQLYLDDRIECLGKTIGIVGVGQCGSRVERVVRALGMIPVLCDPPLAGARGDSGFHPLTYLAQCDFLTLHVPLTREGEDATLGMIGAEFFRDAKRGMILIQASRGGVVNESDMRAAIEAGTIRCAAIDVWENEPAISKETLALARIATPHIAGHSFDGKLLGTEMMHKALCRFAGIPPRWRAADYLQKISHSVVAKLENNVVSAAVADLVLQVHPLMEDDSAMRKLGGLPDSGVPAQFDALRRNYSERREFAAWPVRLSGGNSIARGQAETILRGLGFCDITFD